MSEPGHAEPILRGQGVSKSYPSGGARLVVLEALDVAIQEGEIVAIVGASGVGKSTLLHVLGALDRPERGAVYFRGQDLTTLGDRELSVFRNRTMGFVFQFHYLLPEFTALENVLMPRLIRGERKEDLREPGLSLLDELNVADRAHHRPGALSGGEQQRVAIARALFAEPQVLLADEPTGNLDRRTGEQVFEALASRVAQMRLTTVLVTHNERLSAAAHRVLRLEAGQLVAG